MNIIYWQIFNYQSMTFNWFLLTQMNTNLKIIENRLISIERTKWREKNDKRARDNILH